MKRDAEHGILTDADDHKHSNPDSYSLDPPVLMALVRDRGAQHSGHLRV
jgi:hypothetical protein